MKTCETMPLFAISHWYVIMANFLEQLTCEWYEYEGYFVRRNIRVGKRSKGGHECELDVVAFHPKTRHLVHIEPSMDADSWATRETRYKKKFDAGRKHIPALFDGIQLPDEIEHVELLVFASTSNRKMLAGGRILMFDQFLAQILNRVGKESIAKSAVPEQFALLRTLQFVSHFKETAFDVWRSLQSSDCGITC